MARYMIEIDEDKIREQINGILSEVLNRELRSRYSDSGKVMSDAIKDLIYDHKDEIIDKVVDRASTEVAKKGMKKFVDKMIND